MRLPFLAELGEKDRLSRQYAEFSMPQTSKGSTPAQQKALLEILSREQKIFLRLPRTVNRRQNRRPEAEKNLSPRQGMLGWQAMNHADLDQLLILQEKDVRISKLRKELASLPEQRTRLLKQMEAIKQKALAAKQEVAGIEKAYGTWRPPLKPNAPTSAK